MFRHQAGEEDINNDGKVDIISFSAAVAKDFPIHSVKALLQFHYSISVRTSARVGQRAQRCARLTSVCPLTCNRPHGCCRPAALIAAPCCTQSVTCLN